MKYIIAVLVLVAIWLPTVVLVFKAINQQKYIDNTPAISDEFNSPAMFAWVIGAFSLLATIFLAIFSQQNNWL